MRAPQSGGLRVSHERLGLVGVGSAARYVESWGAFRYESRRAFRGDENQCPVVDCAWAVVPDFGVTQSEVALWAA